MVLINEKTILAGGASGFFVVIDAIANVIRTTWTDERLQNANISEIKRCQTDSTQFMIVTD